MLGSEEEVPCVHDRLDNAQGGDLSLLDWGIFDPIIFELLDESLVQADVR